MSYLTVKQGIAGILKDLELQESEQAFSFVNASSSEYSSTFILRCVSGEMDREDLNSGFTDKQAWEIDIAIPKSSQSDLINMDEIHKIKDSVMTDLDDPAEWRTFARMIKYKSWKIVENPSYYLLTITIDVVDTYTY